MAKTTRNITDYNLQYGGWVLDELAPKPGEQYVALIDLGDLKQGNVGRFVGFDDVDNHDGIFVFVDADGKILEVSGDFAGPDHSRFKEMKIGLARI